MYVMYVYVHVLCICCKYVSVLSIVADFFFFSVSFIVGLVVKGMRGCGCGGGFVFAVFS